MKLDSVSTLPSSFPSQARLRRAHWTRRGGLALLALFIGAGTQNVLGLRMAHVESSQGPYHVRLTYASVSRAGLSTPWEVSVSKRGGFDSVIAIATTIEYLSLYDEHGLSPIPKKTATDGTHWIWYYDPPEGDTLRVSFDGRIKPKLQAGKKGSTLLFQNSVEVASIHYRTRLMP